MYYKDRNTRLIKQLGQFKPTAVQDSPQRATSHLAPFKKPKMVHYKKPEDFKAMCSRKNRKEAFVDAVGCCNSNRKKKKKAWKYIIFFLASHRNKI